MRVRPLGWRLEMIPHRQLHLPWVGPDRCTLIDDVAETRRGQVGDIPSRISPRGVVEHVVSICTEVDLMLVPNREVLGD